MVKYELNYSLENHKVITIIYLKGLEIIQRNIVVLKIENNKITALDIDKNGIKTFKKDKILSAMGSEIVLSYKDKIERYI